MHRDILSRVLYRNHVTSTTEKHRPRRFSLAGLTCSLYSKGRMRSFLPCWSGDAFEIACWNGEKIRVAFALDCCDREAMGFVASTCGISGSMVRDLMLECVEQRFGTGHTPHRIEWLTDNGSCFAARETVAFASWLGLVSRFTPVRSPESNGMAEAFVKTFKRDYVYVHDRPDARTVLSQLSAWFADYNEWHPHKGLRMLSPREFIRSSATERCPV